MAQHLSNLGKTTATTTHPLATKSLGNADKATNLIEVLDKLPEFQLSLEENSWILQCCSCAEFLSSPVSFSSSFRRPSGKATGSLATGLYLSEEVYEQLIASKCDKWYHQKEALIKHLSSKTHINVKTKSAAIQYEE